MECNYDHTGTGLECAGEAAFTMHAHARIRYVCDPMVRRLWTLGKQRCYQCRRPKWTHWEYLPIVDVPA